MKGPWAARHGNAEELARRAARSFGAAAAASSCTVQQQQAVAAAVVQQRPQQERQESSIAPLFMHNNLYYHIIQFPDDSKIIYNQFLYVYFVDGAFEVVKIYFLISGFL